MNPSFSDLLHMVDEYREKINEQRPFDSSLLRQLKDYYKIGLTFSSNALEGNTLTESETKVVLEDGLTIGGKPLRDHYEAVGHGEAFDFMYGLSGGREIREADVLEMHRLFFHRIDEKNAGKYRKVRAIITGSQYPLPKPEHVPSMMRAFMEQVNSDDKSDMHPVELAAKAHLEFVFIHPFVDGNGRIARLLMNLILLRKGYNVALIPTVLRPEYIQAIEKARTDDGDFKRFITRAVLETQKDYLRLIKGV